MQVFDFKFKQNELCCSLFHRILYFQSSFNLFLFAIY